MPKTLLMTLLILIIFIQKITFIGRFSQFHKYMMKKDLIIFGRNIKIYGHGATLAAWALWPNFLIPPFEAFLVIYCCLAILFFMTDKFLIKTSILQVINYEIVVRSAMTWHDIQELSMNLPEFTSLFNLWTDKTIRVNLCKELRNRSHKE